MDREKPVREQDKFMLRLPDGMREKIAELAKASGRSMNAEIVTRLTWTTEAALGDLNLMGINALARWMEATAIAADEAAHQLHYELALANGVGIERDEAMTKAIDAYAVDRGGMNRGIAVRMIVAEHLREQGFLTDKPHNTRRLQVD